uniref:Uncharacterized protein n=1 Tax=Globodera rostochiensis TaxID=31243 RepID=A0A914GYW2_GLORO
MVERVKRRENQSQISSASLAMRLWTAAYLLLIICAIACGEFEEAKNLVSSFISAVDPLSKDLKKAHRFIALTMTFMKGAVPFGELLATALKVGLEEDRLEALLAPTNGIDAKDLWLNNTSTTSEVKRILQPVYSFISNWHGVSGDKPNIGRIGCSNAFARLQQNT